MLTERLSWRFYFFMIAVVLLAAALRLADLTYGTEDPCLLPAAEHWIYERPQPTSLYAWDFEPAVYQVENVYDRLERAVGADPAVFVRWRLWGALLGTLTVLLTMQAGRLLKCNWWLLAALLVAVAPWFVWVDKWVVRFDPAIFVVAVSGVLLIWGRQISSANRLTIVMGWGQQAAALSLLWVAPSLFWLAIILVLLQPRRDWRVVLFVLGAGLIFVPTVSDPASWLMAVRAWDVGVTAACILAGLFAVMAYWRQVSKWAIAGLIVLVIGSGLVTVGMMGLLPRPNPAERAVINFLHEQVPDYKAVQFDSQMFSLMPVAECSHGTEAILYATFPRLYLHFAPVVGRNYPNPDYVVTRDPAVVEDAPFVHEFEDGLYVGRMIDVPQATDIGFGDRFFLIGYDIMTPQVSAGDEVDVRLDFQFSDSTDADSLGYSLFLHVIPQGDPGTQYANYNVNFSAESGNFGPREVVLNQRHRFDLSEDTPPGTYDVLLGIYNIQSGEHLGYWGGDILNIGLLQVQ